MTMHFSIDSTQELIRFNTVNPPGSERPCAERLAGLLENAAKTATPPTRDGRWRRSSTEYLALVPACELK
jgi:acetylornithine deacetylase/succinyl-diaminopimelate desuccinylase-like protein